MNGQRGNNLRVLILGFSYFVNKLFKSLSDFDKKNKYKKVTFDKSIIERIRFIFDLINSDIVYFIGGTINRGEIIDLCLFLNKKIIMHWVGSDVLKAIDSYEKKKYVRSYITKTTHFSEVTWIADELEQLGIKSKIVQFATFDKKISESPVFPSEFMILSYIGKSREDFYGIEKIIKLAKDFPTIKINIVGIDKYNNPLPQNIKLLGWVDDMDEQYKNCVLYLRLPQHDGLAFSVLEALGNGRYVGYSYEFKHTFHVPDYEALRDLVIKLQKEFKEGLLQPNYAGIDFIKNEYDTKKVLGELVTHLQN